MSVCVVLLRELASVVVPEPLVDTIVGHLEPPSEKSDTFGVEVRVRAPLSRQDLLGSLNFAIISVIFGLLKALLVFSNKTNILCFS